jgi:hypothetical protein
MAVNYVEQWKQVEYFDLAYAQSQQVDEVAGVASGCIQCHGPLAFLSGEIPPPHASEGGRVNEGVSCEICHSLTGSYEEAPFNFSAIMNLGETKYLPDLSPKWILPVFNAIWILPQARLHWTAKNGMT